MNFLESIFEVFSRRPAAAGIAKSPVSVTFRNRVLLLCRDAIESIGYAEQFWGEMHKKLEYLHGSPVLSPQNRPRNASEDCFYFLTSCESEHFIDFVEFIFQVESFWRVNDKSGLVAQVNAFFVVDKLPYFLSDYVQIEEAGSFRGSPTTYLKVSAYPRVISKEQDLVHAETIQPTLKLLTQPIFASANSEFLDALEDYRKADYGDCLTKCASAFESVMKILCNDKKWPYKQTDTAAALIDIVVAKARIDNFFTQPLMLIATIRNRLSKSHGAGTTTKDVPAHVAQYAINATAAGILFLVASATK